MEKLDILIIGAGPSGVTSAIYAKRAGLNFLLMEKSAIGGKVVDIFELENYPGVEGMSGSDLALTFRKQIKQLKIPFVRDEVLDIKDNNGTFIVKTIKNEYEVNKIIIACGTKENNLGLESEQKFLGRGVSYCATCDGSFYKDKKVVVYGGGNSAISEALYLANIVKELVIVSRHDLRGEKENTNKLLSLHNVTHIKNSTIIELNGENSLESIKIKNDKDEITTISTDGVFVYIGSKPELSFLNSLNLEKENGYLITNSHFETNIKNVYAIGDCINKELRQIVTATSDGALVVDHIIKSR